ncbi:8-oxo-dGTP diphosphatase [Geothermobacter ehrlichii]|uniref:8-oxo-dGTP diphosphatase n=1 Tax=Geothermobacter ehrlichii TaxID=213224 RepID=A0A5D3WGC4_9BACT|nr:NUDIX hydrolase [Geothermobacter ehrlichii]TYO97484.1 8-oxo-dGTP diphosphatase [Geothermobacter ehrlichii]
MEFKKQHIKTSVVACIVDEQRRVLLTRRCIEPFCSQWVMPGGKIDHGEPILAALHREVREEVGLLVGVDGLIDVYEHIGVGCGQDHYVILYYRCHPTGGNLRPNKTECTEAAWFSREALPGMDLPPGCRHILARVFPELDWGPEHAIIDAAGEIPDQMRLP